MISRKWCHNVAWYMLPLLVLCMHNTSGCKPRTAAELEAEQLQRQATAVKVFSDALTGSGDQGDPLSTLSSDDVTLIKKYIVVLSEPMRLQQLEGVRGLTKIRVPTSMQSQAILKNGEVRWVTLSREEIEQLGLRTTKSAR